MSFDQPYLKHPIQNTKFKLLIVISIILLMSIHANIIFAEEGKFTDKQMSKSLQQQINTLKDKVEEIDKAEIARNKNQTDQVNKILSTSSDTVKYVGVIASIVLPLIILLIGYQVIRSYQFEKEFRNIRKLITDEYDRIINIRSESERFVNETKSKFTNLQELIGELVTNFLMSKTSELINEEKEEREKILNDVKTQVAEVKTTVEDEKIRNSELMNKLEALDLTLTPTVYLERGKIYHDQKNYVKAIENFDQAIKLKGDGGKVYYQRATSYHNIGNYDKAIEDYKIAAKTDPLNKYLFANLGACYLLKQKDDLAIECFNKAIELDPKYAYPHYQKAIIYRKKKKYDLLINEMKEALKIDPNDPRYLSAIGLGYSAMDDPKNAIKYYLESISKRENIGVMMNLAEAYLCDKNWTEAEKIASKCESMASTTHDKVFSKYILLSALILGKKEYKLELKEFSRIVKSSSDFNVGEWTFGEILNCLNNDNKIPAQAVTLIKKIIGFLNKDISEEELLS